MFKEAILAGFVGAAAADLIKFIAKAIYKKIKNKQNILNIRMDLEELKKGANPFRSKNQIKLNNHNQMKTKRHL